MTILYKVHNNLYVNLTNKCPCSCTFCLRQTMDHVGESDSLWLTREPEYDEIIADFANFDVASFDELVFCGFGEPTERLADLTTLMKYVKETHPDVKTRLNTNGLSDLAYKRDTAPDFGGGILDTISISMNASNKERYLELTRSQFGIPSYDAMLQFAQHCKQYVPNVVLTVVDHVEDSEEIRKCRAICQEKGLHLRVRVYEDS